MADDQQHHSWLTSPTLFQTHTHTSSPGRASDQNTPGTSTFQSTIEPAPEGWTTSSSAADSRPPFASSHSHPPPPPPSVSSAWGAEGAGEGSNTPMADSSSPNKHWSPHHDERAPDLAYLLSHNGHPGYHRGHLRQAAEDNVPNRFELFLLGDGEKKVTETPDTRIPNSSLFVFNKEDHTLANMLRSRLLQSPHVQFSGYRVPHPLFSSFELRVQTDGSVTPRAAVVQACRDLVNDLGTLSREFTKEWELRKMAGEGATAPER